MKRLCTSDSMDALTSILPVADEQNPRINQVYNRDYQPMMFDGLDEDCCLEESYHVGEKKRRLSVIQVKALEKNFELENKLEPDRKVKLAQELCLQPRQVAVWFQNRRARWKTKQLERDYGVLKAKYDALKSTCDSLKKDNESFLTEIKELKTKLTEEENPDTNISEKTISETNNKSDNKDCEKFIIPASIITQEPNQSEYKCFDIGTTSLSFSTDSDTSIILNSPKTGLLDPSSSSSPTSINCFRFSSTTQLVKMEESLFSAGDDVTCNFFNDEQAPTLQWYFPDHQWN